MTVSILESEPPETIGLTFIDAVMNGDVCTVAGLIDPEALGPDAELEDVVETLRDHYWHGVDIKRWGIQEEPDEVLAPLLKRVVYMEMKGDPTQAQTLEPGEKRRVIPLILRYHEGLGWRVFKTPRYGLPPGGGYLPLFDTTDL